MILIIDGCAVAIGWMSLDLADDKSITVRGKSRCRWATGHYLNHFLPEPILIPIFTMARWVKAYTKTMLYKSLKLISLSVVMSR